MKSETPAYIYIYIYIYTHTNINSAPSVIYPKWSKPCEADWWAGRGHVIDSAKIAPPVSDHWQRQISNNLYSSLWGLEGNNFPCIISSMKDRWKQIHFQPILGDKPLTYHRESWVCGTVNIGMSECFPSAVSTSSPSSSLIVTLHWGCWLKLLNKINR